MWTFAADFMGFLRISSEHIFSCSMVHGAGIFTNMFPKNHPNVGRYKIHGAWDGEIYMYIYIYIEYTHLYG